MPLSGSEYQLLTFNLAHLEHYGQADPGFEREKQLPSVPLLFSQSSHILSETCKFFLNFAHRLSVFLPVSPQLRQRGWHAVGRVLNNVP